MSADGVIPQEKYTQHFQAAILDRVSTVENTSGPGKINGKLDAMKMQYTPN